MSVLAQAIGSGQWDLAALCLLLGLVGATSKLPADSANGLIDVVAGGEDGKKSRA